MVTSGLQPSAEGSACFPNASLPLFPPFEGGAGGMSLCVRSFVIQSEAKNLFPLPRGIPHCVRNDKGGVRNDKGGRAFLPFCRFLLQARAFFRDASLIFMQRCLVFIQRRLIFIQRRLIFMQRCLIFIQRRLIFIRRCLLFKRPCLISVQSPSKKGRGQLPDRKSVV